MKRKIYPAILEKTFKTIERKLEVSKKLSNEVQVDICDGKFVPSKTYASTGSINSFIKIGDSAKFFDLELDMMINWTDNNFDKWVDSILESGPRKVIIHKSSISEENLLDLVSIFKSEKIKIGLGVHLQDKNSEVEKLLDYVDYIQIMGIEKVGYSGEKLSSRVYTKIKHFRKKYPKLKIAIDGGVKEDNLDKLFKAGASMIGANSMIFKDKNPERFFN